MSPIFGYYWFNQDLFEGIEEVQDAATKWLWTYNNERPNMAIGDITQQQKLQQSRQKAA